MEKRTIGGFIAALRKANGMTQKELADRLNVFDKTISRWERGDGDPDLAAISVIAEIFGVSCDELLRGERKSPGERSELAENSGATPKGERERQRILRSTLSQYQSRTYLALGISVVGLIASMIGNLAFLRAVLGFLLGAVFFTASIVCQVLCAKQALFRVEDADISASDLSAFKLQVIRSAQRSVGLTVGLIGFTFPLILVDAYAGLGVDNLLLFAVPGAVIFLAIFAIVCYFLNAAFLKRGVYSLGPRAKAAYWHNHKLKRRCAVGFTVALVITLVVHVFGSSRIWNAHNLARGTTFSDYESFVAYMGQDIPYDRWSGSAVAPAPEVGVEDPADDALWYDANGNTITREEAHTCTLEDANGVVVCTYIHFNRTVVSLRYEKQDGSVLPITAISQIELENAWRLHDLITTAYYTLYLAELAVVLLIYFRKRLKSN